MNARILTDELQALQSDVQRLQKQKTNLEETLSAADKQIKRLLSDNKVLELNINTLRQRLEEHDRRAAILYNALNDILKRGTSTILPQDLDTIKNALDLWCGF